MFRCFLIVMEDSYLSHAFDRYRIRKLVSACIPVPKAFYNTESYILSACGQTFKSIWERFAGFARNVGAISSFSDNVLSATTAVAVSNGLETGKNHDGRRTTVILARFMHFLISLSMSCGK